KSTSPGFEGRAHEDSPHAQRAAAGARRAGEGQRRSDAGRPCPASEASPSGVAGRLAQEGGPTVIEDRDREELGDALEDETKAELDRIALAHARAVGRPVAVAAFAGSDSALVLDRLGPPLRVPLRHPSLSLSL